VVSGVVVSGGAVSHAGAWSSAQMSHSWLITTVSCILPVLMSAFHQWLSCWPTDNQLESGAHSRSADGEQAEEEAADVDRWIA